MDQRWVAGQAGDQVPLEFLVPPQLRLQPQLATASAMTTGMASAHPQNASMTATASVAGMAAARAGPRSTREAAVMQPR